MFSAVSLASYSTLSEESLGEVRLLELDCAEGERTDKLPSKPLTLDLMVTLELNLQKGLLLSKRVLQKNERNEDVPTQSPPGEHRVKVISCFVSVL
jgi:hypothetical protein